MQQESQNFSSYFFVGLWKLINSDVVTLNES